MRPDGSYGFSSRVLSLFPQSRFRVGTPWASIRCPFHEDRKPSASVNLESGSFRCFSCGESFRFRDLLARVGEGHDHVPSAARPVRREPPVPGGPTANLDGLAARAWRYLAHRPDLLRALERRFGLS